MSKSHLKRAAFCDDLFFAGKRRMGSRFEREALPLGSGEVFFLHLIRQLRPNPKTHFSVWEPQRLPPSPPSKVEGFF